MPATQKIEPEQQYCPICGQWLRWVDSSFCDRECLKAWVEEMNKRGFSLEYRNFMTDER